MTLGTFSKHRVIVQLYIIENVANMSEPNNKTCPFSPDIAAAAGGPCPLNGSGGQYDHRVAAMNNV